MVRFPYQRIKCCFDLLSLWDWNFCSIYSIFPEKLRNSEWTRQGCLLPSHPQSGIPWLWLSSSRAPLLVVCSAAFIGELSLVLSRRPLGCLTRCCVGHPAAARVVEAPHEEQGLDTQGCFRLSLEALVHLFCLVWQLIAGTPWVSPTLHSSPLSSQLAHHPSVGKALCVTVVLSQRGDRTSHLLIFPTCPS